MKTFISQNLTQILVAIGILVGAFLLSKLLGYLMNRSMNRSSKLINIDRTNFSFFRNAINFVLFTIAVIAVFYSIPTLRAVGISMLAGAGIFAVVLGLASQQAFSNIISGIFIVVFRPFRVGDFVTINTYVGTVEDITLRHTIIKNIENKRIVIPNSIISSETIVNAHIADAKVCAVIEFNIAYSASIDKAMDFIRDEARKHPSYIDNRRVELKTEKDTDVIVRVLRLTEYSVLLRAQVWATDNDRAFVMKCDLLKSVKERFDTEGIEIPYRYVNVLSPKAD